MGSALAKGNDARISGFHGGTSASRWASRMLLAAHGRHPRLGAPPQTRGWPSAAAGCVPAHGRGATAAGRVLRDELAAAWLAWCGLLMIWRLRPCGALPSGL